MKITHKAERIQRRVLASRVVKTPQLCPLCGGPLVAANKKIVLVVGRPFLRRPGRTTFTRKRRGCKGCGIVVVLHRWRD